MQALGEDIAREVTLSERALAVIALLAALALLLERRLRSRTK
jgi:hypothetical protein